MREQEAKAIADRKNCDAPANQIKTKSQISEVNQTKENIAFSIKPLKDLKKLKLIYQFIRGIIQ